jgi:nitroreductase
MNTDRHWCGIAGDLRILFTAFGRALGQRCSKETVLELYEAIRQRYSVRAYLDKPLEDDTLNRVLEAGRLAPSGNNRQAWKFVVAQDPKLRSHLARACEQPFLAQAPVVIAVVGTDPHRKMSCDITGDPVDCAIAVSFMTLAATAEGLGTCWIGHFNQDACRELLHVPSSCKIVALLPVGYPGQAAPPARPRKSLAEVVSYDSF